MTFCMYWNNNEGHCLVYTHSSLLPEISSWNNGEALLPMVVTMIAVGIRGQEELERVWNKSPLGPL